MNLRSIRFFLIVLFSFQLIQIPLQAQVPPINRYDDVIRSFLHSDSVSTPKKGGILFIGSSSIGRWNDLEERFRDYTLIRRGFGGSTFAEILHYSKDILFPYRPSKIFLYAGENDLVQGKSVAEIMQTIEQIHDQIKQTLPFTSLYIISVKPSNKLKAYSSEIQVLNDRIEKYIAQANCAAYYVDIYQGMLDEHGAPNADLFVSDQLHLTPEGYDVWEKEIRKYL